MKPQGRILAALIAALLAFGGIACGGGERALQQQRPTQGPTLGGPTDEET